MERFEVLGKVLVIILVIAITIIVISFVVRLSPEGGKTPDNPLIVSSLYEIDIDVSILKNEYFLDFYYYWDEPSNRVNLEKGIFNAYGKTNVPSTPGVHKLVVVRGLFAEKHEYYYKVAD